MVNVYAKDIACLPEWQQKLWSGFNLGPEGGVSEELLAAQAGGTPAGTQAPEAFLPNVFELLNEITGKKFGFRLFREHEQFDRLIKSAHRFRATNRTSLFSLAKDLARLTAESIDTSALKNVVTSPKGVEWKSLKSLENLVALKTGPADAGSALGPLVGINELRQADAHLPSGDIENAFNLAQVDQTKPFVWQGYRLLHACVSSLYTIAQKLQKFPDKSD